MVNYIKKEDIKNLLRNTIICFSLKDSTPIEFFINMRFEQLIPDTDGNINLLIISPFGDKISLPINNIDKIWIKK